MKRPPNLSPKQLTSKQKSVLIGTLLGDGWMGHNTNTLLKIERTPKDFNYLKWEYSLFKDFCLSGIKKCNRKDGQKSVYFCTRRCEAFNDYYNKWYDNKDKHLPSNLKLDPLSLAIWFCDDGSISKYNNRFRCTFSTHCFTKKEVIFLITILKRAFNINANIIQLRKSQWGIEINILDELKKLANIIGAHVIYMMPRKYKKLNQIKNTIFFNNRVRKNYKSLKELVLKRTKAVEKTVFNFYLQGKNTFNIRDVAKKSGLILNTNDGTSYACRSTKSYIDKIVGRGWIARDDISPDGTKLYIFTDRFHSLMKKNGY